MEYLPYITIACLLGVILLGALAWFNRHRVEAVTTEALLKIAQDAVAEAQKLVDLRAQAIEDSKASVAADRERIAKALAKLAGNAAPPA